MRAARATEPIRVLRVIARLNVGGPALHVTYLTDGLAERGYETTLVAGDVSRGEESMAFVAEQRGVEVSAIPELSRELSPVRDLRASSGGSPRSSGATGRTCSTRTPRRRARSGRARGPPRRRRAPAGRRPHLPRPRPARVLRPGSARSSTGGSRRPWRATTDAPDRRQPRGARRARRARRRARDAVRGRPARHRALRAVRAPSDGAELRAALGIAPDRFVVGWFGRMTAVKRTDDVLRRVAALRDRGVDAALVLVGDGPDRERARGARSASSGSRRDAASSATRTTSARGSTPSTRSC